MEIAKTRIPEEGRLYIRLNIYLKRRKKERHYLKRKKKNKKKNRYRNQIRRCLKEAYDKSNLQSSHLESLILRASRYFPIENNRIPKTQTDYRTSYTIVTAIKMSNKSKSPFTGMYHNFLSAPRDINNLNLSYKMVSVFEDWLVVMTTDLYVSSWCMLVEMNELTTGICSSIHTHFPHTDVNPNIRASSCNRSKS